MIRAIIHYSGVFFCFHFVRLKFMLISLSNQLQETTAWKTLTAHPNSLVQLLPSRAMRVVQEVVRSFRVSKS